MNRWHGRLRCCQYLRHSIVLETSLTAGNQDKATESEDESHSQSLLQLHLKLHDHGDGKADDDEVREDVEKDGNPVIDSGCLLTTLI